MITTFKDLDVYKEALQLSYEIEFLIRVFPASEKYLLCDQMRRASRGIAPLIAEGYAKRQSLKVFQKYIRDAIGEANEIMCHLELADRLGHIKRKDFSKELIRRYDVLGKKLSNLKDNWKNY